MQASRNNYLTTGTGVLDYSRLNQERLSTFTQFDFRIDKKLNFKNKTLDIYIDIQNAFAKVNASLPNYTFQRTADNSSWLSTDGNQIRADGTNAIPLILNDDTALILPSFGFILEF